MKINYRSTDTSATIAVNHSGRPGEYSFVMTSARKLKKDLETQVDDLTFEQGLHAWAEANAWTEADLDAMFAHCEAVKAPR